MPRKSTRTYYVQRHHIPRPGLHLTKTLFASADKTAATKYLQERLAEAQDCGWNIVDTPPNQGDLWYRLHADRVHFDVDLYLIEEVA